MSRILLWSPNYAPELTGIPPLVTEAAEWLAARGHVVDVVAPFPNYPERVIHPEYRRRLWSTERRNGVSVHRHWLRVRPGESFLDKALYEATSSTAALPLALRLARSADVVVCVVPTLSAAFYATTLLRRPVVLWIQDLVLSAAASVGSGAIATRVLAAAERVEQRALRRAERVLVCSPGFAEAFVARGVDPARVDVLYNWVDLDWIAPTPPRRGAPARCLYSGNLGYTQGFETLVGAARQAEGIEVEIVGTGNAAAQVEELARGVENVTVRPPVPRAELPDLLASADIHVVVQRRISAGANLPSKIATALASGRPIVASIDPSTSAAALLRRSGGAILVEPESPSALAEALRSLAADADLRDRLAAAGRAFAEATLGKAAALERLERVALGALSAASGARPTR